MHLCNLPNEIINAIFSYLDDASSQALAITCIKMFRVWKKTYSLESLLYKYIPDKISEVGINKLRELFYKYSETKYLIVTSKFKSDWDTGSALHLGTNQKFVPKSENVMDNKMGIVYNLYFNTSRLTPYKLIKLYYAKLKINKYKKKNLKEVECYNPFKNLMCEYINDNNLDTDMIMNNIMCNGKIYNNPINYEYYQNKLQNELKKYRNNNYESFINGIINSNNDERYVDKLLFDKLIDKYEQPPNEFENYNLLLDDTYTEISHL